MDLHMILRALGLDLGNPWRLLAAVISHATRPMVREGILDALKERVNAPARRQLARDLRAVAKDLESGKLPEAADRLAEMIGAIRL